MCTKAAVSRCLLWKSITEMSNTVASYLVLFTCDIFSYKGVTAQSAQVIHQNSWLASSTFEHTATFTMALASALIIFANLKIFLCMGGFRKMKRKSHAYSTLKFKVCRQTTTWASSHHCPLLMYVTSKKPFYHDTNMTSFDLIGSLTVSCVCRFYWSVVSKCYYNIYHKYNDMIWLLP